MTNIWALPWKNCEKVSVFWNHLTFAKREAASFQPEECELFKCPPHALMCFLSKVYRSSPPTVVWHGNLYTARSRLVNVTREQAVGGESDPAQGYLQRAGPDIVLHGESELSCLQLIAAVWLRGREKASGLSSHQSCSPTTSSLKPVLCSSWPFVPSYCRFPNIYLHRISPQIWYYLNLHSLLAIFLWSCNFLWYSRLCAFLNISLWTIKIDCF